MLCASRSPLQLEFLLQKEAWPRVVLMVCLLATRFCCDARQVGKYHINHGWLKETALIDQISWKQTCPRCSAAKIRFFQTVGSSACTPTSCGECSFIRCCLFLGMKTGFSDGRFRSLRKPKHSPFTDLADITAGLRCSGCFVESGEQLLFASCWTGS